MAQVSANETANKTANETGNDYLNIVLTQTHGKIFRFKKMPVAVFISGCGDGEERACDKAFALWTTRTDNLIQFQKVADKKRARVLLKFVRLPQSTEDIPGASAADGGHTLLSWHPRRKILQALSRAKMHVPPQIVEVNLNALDARPQSARETALQNIIAHELGHAIGLLAHSADPGDLMYTKTDENSQLSARDLNTVQKLYALPPDVCL